MKLSLVLRRACGVNPRRLGSVVDHRPTTNVSPKLSSCKPGSSRLRSSPSSLSENGCRAVARNGTDTRARIDDYCAADLGQGDVAIVQLDHGAVKIQAGSG